MKMLYYTIDTLYNHIQGMYYLQQYPDHDRWYLLLIIALDFI